MKNVIVVVCLMVLSGCATASFEKANMHVKELTLSTSHYEDTEDIKGDLKAYGCQPVSIEQEPNGFNQFHKYTITCR